MELKQNQRGKSPFIPSLTEGDFPAGKLKAIPSGKRPKEITFK
jgi:hypothetical protein